MWRFKAQGKTEGLTSRGRTDELLGLLRYPLIVMVLPADIVRVVIAIEIFNHIKVCLILRRYVWHWPNAVSKVIADLVVPDAIFAKESGPISRISQQRRIRILQ